MGVESNPKLKGRAQRLRKNMTPQERHLWYDFLSTYPVHFRRQRTIGPYIVDFYCAAASLVVEIDGSQHFEPEDLEYDRQRTEYLQQRGLEVARYDNSQVNTEFPAVCLDIENRIHRKLGKDHSPEGGKTRENDI